MDRPLSFKIILLLAVVQGFAGLLRGFNWLEIGVDLFGQGILLFPFLGAVAVMRGLLISVVAFLYVLFVIGAFLGRSWAWWVCFTAVVVNLFVVLSSFAQGAPAAQAIAWSVIPVVLLYYLFSKIGRDTLKSG